RAGLNKQLIYYYFHSKAGLHAAATAATDQHPDGPGAAAASESAPGAVRAAIGRLLSSLENRPEFVALLVDRFPSPDARVQARAWITQAAADVGAAISRGQGMGYFRDEVDPDGMAQQAIVLCAGYLALRDHLSMETGGWERGVSETLLRAATW
ncbi:MAG: TetR/AcrR family transcriptional regulator, partial [Gemmatimonadota bacterium]|nr:TetR/AcrR family transcriptional regulator [Gemmatimonadota bacterium]